MIKNFSINKTGRDFVVGDIHGFFTKLKNQLDEIGFDYENDRLFAVGDLVDRGPECTSVLEWLNHDWFHSIRGNHEEMAIDFYNRGSLIEDNWMHIGNGGKWFVDESRESQSKFIDAFLKLPYTIDVMTKNGLVGLVHAESSLNNWWDFQKKIVSGDNTALLYALWNRNRIEYNNDSVITDLYKLYVGHTPVESIHTLGNVCYIDVHSYTRDKFAIIEL